MTMLGEVGTYLDAQLVALTAGTNLFGGVLPEDPVEAVAIFENTSVGPVETQGGATAPVMERPRLQVIVRSDDYAKGRLLIEQVYKTLQVVVNTTMSGTLYYRIASVDMPELLDRDSRQQPIFSCNFDVWKAPSA